MTPEVRARYTPEVRAAVARAAGGPPEALQDLGGFESFVHELIVDGIPRIVKATWSGRRSAEAMGAELHFVRYLADADAPVCPPLPLADGSDLARVPCEGGAFHVTAWTKAPGTRLPRTEFSPAVMRDWGALVGTLHRLSAAYPGPPPPLARPTWREELDAILDASGYEPDLRADYDDLVAELEARPRDPSVFGPIHTDLHHGNIHWHDGAMRVFDFEDMIDFWFVSDLAIVLFYAVNAPSEPEGAQARYDRFAPPLLEGYAAEHVLPAEQLALIPRFLRLREHVLRAVTLRSTPEARWTPGWRRFMEEAAARIRAGEPALGLNA